MAKKKGLDLEKMDLSKYGVNSAPTSESKEETAQEKEETPREKEKEQPLKENKEIKGIRAVKDIEIKKKLIAYPKHYEEAINAHLEDIATATKKPTVQDFILEALEEKLVSLGF